MPQDGSPRRDFGITLSALRTFIAVVEQGSFSRAAVALGVSQPSVSVQLNSLERACRVLLLHRRPRLELTDAGRDLLVRARLIVSRLAEFERSVDDLHALQQGHLLVGLSGPHVALRLIAGFVEQHPAITLATRVGNSAMLLEDIAQCRIDVGIVALGAPSGGLWCRRLMGLELALCVPRGHAMAGRKRVAPEDFVDLPYIRREAGSVTRETAERVFGLAAPVARLEITGREAMKEAIVAGLGVGVLFAHEADGDDRLAVIPIAWGEESAAIYAVALEESRDIPVVGAFLAHLQTWSAQ